MSGNPARKIMRTKREQAMLMENINKNSIGHLIQELQSLRENEHKFLGYMAFFQRELLAIKNVLMRRNVLSELEIHQELSRLDELAKMEAQAVDLSKAREAGIAERKKEQQNGKKG